MVLLDKVTLGFLGQILAFYLFSQNAFFIPIFYLIFQHFYKNTIKIPNQQTTTKMVFQI